MKTKRKSALIAKLYQALKKDRQFRAGVIGVIILLLLVVLAPVLTTYNPFEYGADSLAGIGENGHLLGTNHMGQDVYSMLIYGIRTSLKVALISSLISGALGIIIGGVAGFFGGKVDLVISELINAFLMIPTFFLILVIVALYGNSIANVMIVIGITSWPGNAKLMRAQALSLRERTFVKSAVTMGETRTQILCKYILPNGIFPVIANTTRGMAGAIRFDGPLLELPASLCVRVRFRGHHLQSPEQYRRLTRFMQEHSLSASGFSREITMIDHGFTRDREKFVTEITVPVEKVFR